MELINEAFVKPYFGGKKEKNYAQAVDIYDHMSFHFDGYFIRPNELGGFTVDLHKNRYFHRLIDMRRPSESDVIKEYRRDIYLPITKIPCYKVTNSLKKIVKSQDWNIDYTLSYVPNSLPDDETLEVYCEKKYPFFKSVENWMASYGLNQLFKDPNSVIVVEPTNIDKGPEEWYTPFSYVIPSKKVLGYAENEFCVY